METEEIVRRLFEIIDMYANQSCELDSVRSELYDLINDIESVEEGA